MSTLTHAAPYAQALPAAPSLVSTLLALVLVIGLILALAWVLRRMPGNAFSGSAGLRPVASLALGTRERLLVVEVGGEQLLLGVSVAGIQLLHKLEQPLATPAPTVDFAALLGKRLLGKTEPRKDQAA